MLLWRKLKRLLVSGMITNRNPSSKSEQYSDKKWYFIFVHCDSYEKGIYIVSEMIFKQEPSLLSIRQMRLRMMDDVLQSGTDCLMHCSHGVRVCQCVHICACMCVCACIASMRKEIL